MTKRLQYPTYWASGGVATDPDLDTTAPSYQPNKYEQHGWEAEKPPEEWQNFITQITDEKIIARMVDGFQLFDSSVTYSEGAVYRKGDKFYKIESGVEQEILEVKLAVYQSLVDGMNTLLNDHLAADNPHKDTVDTLVGGGYIKSDVDKFFGDPNDPQTIVYHKNQMGAGVHGETAASTGALPAATGGTFTGDVIFLDDAIIQVTPSKSVHMNKSTALFEIVNGTYSLGVDANGNGYIVSTSGATLIISELNLDTLTMKYNNSFTLPPPFVRVNMRSDLSDGNGIGVWTLDTPADPVFADGLQVDNNAAILTFESITGIRVTVHLLVTQADGTKQSIVRDFADWNSGPRTGNLQTMVGVSFGGTNPKYFREYTVYPALTARQKTMLVNK